MVWELRYITKEEGAALQSLNHDRIKLPFNDNAAFEALGNAVNADIVYFVAKELIKVQEKNICNLNNSHMTNSLITAL